MSTLTTSAASENTGKMTPFEAGRKIIEQATSGYPYAVATYKAFIAQGNTQQDLHHAHPHVAMYFWNTIKLLAENVIPELLVVVMPTIARTMRTLSPKEQMRILNEGVDVRSSDGSCLKVRLQSLTTQQRRMVFAKDHIRTIAEQRNWVEGEILKRRLAPEEKPVIKLAKWEYVQGGVNTLVTGFISNSDILRMARHIRGA